MVELNGDDGLNVYGVYPFAKRYVGEDYLVHRLKYGGELLLRKEEVKVLIM